MADNIGYTPGYGAQIAADEVNGALVQRVKPTVGVDGQAVDVSEANPMPVALTEALVDAIENLRAAITSMNRRNTLNTTDGGGRQRVVTDAASSMNVVSIVGTVNTIGNISAGNITALGGVGTYDVAKAISRQGYNSSVRANLSFS